MLLPEGQSRGSISVNPVMPTANWPPKTKLQECWCIHWLETMASTWPFPSSEHFYEDVESYKNDIDDTQISDFSVGRVRDSGDLHTAATSWQGNVSVPAFSDPQTRTQHFNQISFMFSDNGNFPTLFYHQLFTNRIWDWPEKKRSTYYWVWNV